MFEWLAPGFIYSIVKDVWKRLQSRRSLLSPARILELRQKWKPLFEKVIWEAHRRGLRNDVIVRDVRRLDIYPNIADSDKGISPWFRVGLIGTYHKGILVGLGWHSLVKHGTGDDWRFADHKANESGNRRVALVGRIPFENIEAVDWNGDEYYGFPHIFCYFDARQKEPYEALAFCEERCNPGGLPFYVEVAPYEKVRQLSKSLDIDSTF